MERGAPLGRAVLCTVTAQAGHAIRDVAGEMHKGSVPSIATLAGSDLLRTFISDLFASA